MQPIYEKLQPKIEARRINIEFYRQLTGNQQIPPTKGYWTLCCEQTESADSEIRQFIAAQLITEDQFHGVDKDQDEQGRCLGIIERNKKRFPQAHWYQGDWLHEIESSENAFNPAMVYLDLTSQVHTLHAAELAVRTMLRCSAGTVLFANFMLNDPYSSRRFNPDCLMENISKRIPSREYKTWGSPIQSYDYCATGRTLLRTFILHKER